MHDFFCPSCFIILCSCISVSISLSLKMQTLQCVLLCLCQCLCKRYLIILLGTFSKKTYYRTFCVLTPAAPVLCCCETIHLPGTVLGTLCSNSSCLCDRCSSTSTTVWACCQTTTSSTNTRRWLSGQRRNFPRNNVNWRRNSWKVCVVLSGSLPIY